MRKTVVFAIFFFMMFVLMTTGLMAQQKTATNEFDSTALPELQFKVNGKWIDGCINCATAEAEETGKPIIFVVGKKEFAAEKKAKTALLVTSEKIVKTFSMPQKDEVAKTISVAGKICLTPKEVAERQKLVKTAMGQVKMRYQVGDKSFDSLSKAEQQIKATGSPMEFVIGENRTHCEITAKLELVRAQYNAALKAIARLDQKSATKTGN